jgi:DNA-directed RNA polymerase specialized sigma subunit
MLDLSFSDHLQEALTSLEKAEKTLRKSSRLSTLDIENLNSLTEKIKLIKTNMIAVMSTQHKVVDVAEHFGITTGRVYQIRTEYLKDINEK